jgi:hypothetical protein
VITLTPVLERSPLDCPFWPVERTDFVFAIPRVPTLSQVGTVVWMLIANSVDAASSAAGAIEDYLNCEEDAFAQGGLRLSGGDVVIDPGCCTGIGEWRDWLRILDGQVIDLGHDPWPLVEHRGPLVRVWADEDPFSPAGPRPPDGPHIDLPRDALPGLLRGVQEDLAGFLSAVRPWASDIRADLAEPLALALDQCLQISAPLGV